MKSDFEFIILTPLLKLERITNNDVLIGSIHVRQGKLILQSV